MLLLLCSHFFPPSFSDFQINFNLFSNSVLSNPCSLLCLFSDSNLNLDWISEAHKLYEQLHNKTTTRKLEQIIYKRIPKKEVFS